MMLIVFDDGVQEVKSPMSACVNDAIMFHRVNV